MKLRQPRRIPVSCTHNLLVFADMEFTMSGSWTEAGWLLVLSAQTVADVSTPGVYDLKVRLTYHTIQVRRAC
jgi:hypothetical protein